MDELQILSALKTIVSDAWYAYEKRTNSKLKEYQRLLSSHSDAVPDAIDNELIHILTNRKENIVKESNDKYSNYYAVILEWIAEKKNKKY